MPIKYHENSTKILAKITPNAKTNSIIGVIDIGDGKKALKINIKAVAEDGKANKELIDFLSKKWKIAKKDIEIISGDSCRIKTLLINKNNFIPQI